MSFGDVSSPAGLKKLNDFLRDKSYLQGYQPSQEDSTTFEAVKTAPAGSYPYALRWFNHIKSFGDLRKQFPVGSGANNNAVKVEVKVENDDDDVDLFGSDEDDEEAAKIKAERVAAYAEKKSKKPTLIAKSNVILDVKPWSDETDMAEMEKNVRSIVMEGLLWGASKLVPVGYGIKKLQISCVVEDDKVSIDELSELIEAFEDHVQSIDVAAFNKI